MTETKTTKTRELSVEGIQKPGIVKQLMPLALTLVIFVWLYFTIDFSQMFRILGQAKLNYFIPCLIGFVIMLAIIDAFTFGQAYSWFCTRLTTYEKLEIRIAPYVIQVVFAPLVEVLFLLYLWRKSKVPPTRAMSASIWTIVNDYAALATAITIAVIYNHQNKLVPQINIYWLITVIVFWVFYFSNLIFWHSSLQPRIAAWVERSHITRFNRQATDSLFLKIAGGAIQLLHTFSIARWYHYLFVYGLRVLAVVGILVSNYAALKALDINVTPALAIIAIPLIYTGYFLPINIGGFGGPQALALLFFYEIGHCGSKEQIIAYSFLWSTGFLVCRFFLGLIFIHGFWQNAFPEGFTKWFRRNSS